MGIPLCPQSSRGYTHDTRPYNPSMIECFGRRPSQAYPCIISHHTTLQQTRVNIRIFLDGQKITSSIKSALYLSWGSRVAQTFYDKRKIICLRHFHLVDWENLDRTIQSLPKMFQVWVTKHVSGFCGINKHISCLYPSTSDRCQCCGTPAETPAHITRCPNLGGVKMFDETVTLLIQ